MNIKNNKRRQVTREKIERVFLNLLQGREIAQISISDICKEADINRSTFYANYQDIYALADRVRDRLVGELDRLYDNDYFNNCGNDYLKLFRHIRDNQIFYSTYFKLGYDSRQNLELGMLNQKNMVFPEEQMAYHMEFHRAGITAIIKKWLAGGCREEPEFMVKIIQDEYNNRQQV